MSIKKVSKEQPKTFEFNSENIGIAVSMPGPLWLSKLVRLALS